MTDSPRLPWWHLALVLLVGLLANVPFFSAFEGMGDEAVTTLGALRLLAGEHCYHDFVSRHTPGSYFLTAAFFSISGSGVEALRTLMLLNAAFLSAVQFGLARELLTPRWALLASLLWTTTGVTQWPILSYHWLATAAYLATLWALLVWARRPTPKMAALVGAGSAATVWLLQTEGVAIVLTALIVGGTLRKRFALPFTLSAVAASLLLWLPVLATASLAEIYADSVTSMKWHVPFNRSPYSWEPLLGPTRYLMAHLHEGTWEWIVHTASLLIVWYCKHGLYFPVLLVGVGLAWRGPVSLRILVLGQGILTLLCWNRQDMLYINYISAGFYILLADQVRRLPAARIWGTVLAALFILQYGFIVADGASFRYPLRTPRGTLYCSTPAQAGPLQALYDTAARLTPPGTVTFAYPYATEFYYLSGTRNATRFPLLVPFLDSHEELEQAIQQLETARPQYVYRFPCNASTVIDYPTVDVPKFLAELAWLDEQILHNYARMSSVGPYEIWQRK